MKPNGLRMIRRMRMICPREVDAVKRCFFLVLLALGIGVALLPKGAEPPKPQPTATPAPPGCRVLLNGYAPDEWNGGYGHYDLSFLAPEGMVLKCRLREISVEGSELTLSYGPTGGDASPARVNLYVGTRSDHIPRERLVVYDGLSLADYCAFMEWFDGEFAAYDRMEAGHLVLRVLDADYATYSLREERNCLSAALHMLRQVPGVHDGRRNSCAALVERLEMSLK